MYAEEFPSNGKDNGPIRTSRLPPSCVERRSPEYTVSPSLAALLPTRAEMDLATMPRGGLASSRLVAALAAETALSVACEGCEGEESPLCTVVICPARASTQAPARLHTFTLPSKTTTFIWLLS